MTSKVARRLNRILLMVPFMVADEGAKISDLCEKFGIEYQELMGDLETLSMCGLPDYSPYDLIDYRVEGDHVRLVMADFFERPLNLTREEALALAVAGRALLRSGIFEKDGPLSTSLYKIERLLSGGEQIDVEDLAGRIDVEMNEYNGRWRELIERGLEERRNLEIDYYSLSRDEVGTREVEPLSLLWSRGYWYLLAWCHQARDRRLFRMDRIKSVVLTEHRSSKERTGGIDVPALVGEFKPDRKAHKVRLRFSGREGRRIVEEWPTAKVSEEDDGTLNVELRTRNLDWLPNYLLRFGDRVRVDSPKELRQMIRERAGTLLEEYR